MRADPSKSPTFLPRFAAAISPWAALALGSALALTACKKKGPTCDPEDEKKQFEKFRVVVQPVEINKDTDGNPRATSLRIYQIKGGRSLDVPLDFRQVWEEGGAAFGDELLKEEELTVVPDKNEVFEIEREADATHVVAAAIFREPVGTTWYAEWEVPQFHGYSVCAAEKKKQKYEDPCFLIYMEGSQLDGGHKPPPGFDEKAFEVLCPGEPLKVKPADAEMSEKEKKKAARKKKRKERREKLKGKAGDAQDSAEGAQEKNDAAQGAGDSAKGAGETATDPPVPGKD